MDKILKTNEKNGQNSSKQMKFKKMNKLNKNSFNSKKKNELSFPKDEFFFNNAGKAKIRLIIKMTFFNLQ